ncbi:histone deacetylase 11 isoform X2 [Anarrhichthys ocellatus]|uniref:histone deacetylase 11 isoform X2 n=1 Tax=Anarrhichthys ocellatus TaxID=433405 RepID=UPI0012EDF1B0|nr:histone deacetylase 11 isoform X2 [Anarrhichthys ocellatus]
MAHKADNEGTGSSHHTELYASIPRTCLPIVYHPDYNMTFMGLEKLHPFDAGKWGKVIHFLKEEQLVTDGNMVEAREATEEDLLVVHTKRYLNRLKWSLKVATITEIPPLMFLPNFLVQRKVLRPLRTQTGGTIMAAKLAVDRGWAINVGGGFHHCSSDSGGGFCAYADITLAIKFLFERVEGISRATIIDLDAHQGNGHERDFLDDGRVYIMDVYNRYIYPGDGYAKKAIKRKVELDWGTEDTEYLQKVELHTDGALNEVRPDIIVYNAGTDILDGDPLGGLSISPQISSRPSLPGHHKERRDRVQGRQETGHPHTHGDVWGVPEANRPHHRRLHPQLAPPGPDWSRGPGGGGLIIIIIAGDQHDV